MTKAIVFFLVFFLRACALSPWAVADTPDSILPIPAKDDKFFSYLQNHLKNEAAQEHVEWDEQGLYAGYQGGVGWVTKGCLGATVGGLTHTPKNGAGAGCTAYPGWNRTTETQAITYPDDSVCWVVIHKDTTGNTGTFTRVASTHFLTDCTSSTRPTQPTNSLFLMRVTTSGGAITVVDDLRKMPGRARPVTLYASQFGIGGSTDDTAHITKLFATICSGGIGHVRVLFDVSVTVNSAPDIPVCAGLWLDMLPGMQITQPTMSIGSHAIFLVTDQVGGPRFTNLVFDQGNTTPSYDVNKVLNTPIWVRNSSGVHIEGCSLLHLWGAAGIRFDANTTATTHSDDNWVVDNTFSACAATGVTIFSGQRNHIVHNTFSDCSFGASPASSSNVAADNLFVDNTVTGIVRTPDDAVGMGIFFLGKSAADKGNRFAGNRLNGTNVAITTATDLSFVHNSLANANAALAAGAPMVISGMVRGQIVGNTIDATTFTAANADAVGALTMTTSNDVLVVDNTVYGATLTHGMAFGAGNTRVSVARNVVRDNGGSGIRSSGTTASHFDDNELIDNNPSNSASEGGIWFTATSGGCVRCTVTGGRIVSPAGDKQGTPIVVQSTVPIRVTNVITQPRQGVTAIGGTGATSVLLGNTLARRLAAQTTTLSSAVDLLTTPAGESASIGDTFKTEAAVTWASYNGSSDTFTYTILVSGAVVCTLVATPTAASGAALIRSTTVITTAGAAGVANCSIDMVSSAATGAPLSTVGTTVNTTAPIIKTRVTQSTTRTFTEVTATITEPTL